MWKIYGEKMWKNEKMELKRQFERIEYFLGNDLEFIVYLLR